MPIIRINEFRARPETADALRDFLASVIHMIEGAPGCLRCELAAALDDPTRLVIVEVWDSTEHHQAAASRVPPDKLSEVRALLAETPRGQYYDRL